MGTKLYVYGERLTTEIVVKATEMAIVTETSLPPKDKGGMA